jgi:V8-like Glu-specific endopeptidase
MTQWGRERPVASPRGLRTLSTLLPAALLIAASLAPGAASASGVRVASSSADAVNSFWTPGRIRAAQPLEVKAGDAAIASTAPGPGAGEFGSNFEPVPDPTAPAYRVNGAIFTSLGVFGYARCSGTAVTAANESVVITAGHCVNSGGRRGRWYKDRWAFIPAYRFGQRPFGIFPARWLDTTVQWRRSGSENFDVGAAVVGRNGRGETLEEAVGGVGIAWNLKPRQTFDVHGYPAEEPFDGETQRVCPSTPFIGHDPDSFVFPGPLNLSVRCDVTGGASGGGWIIHGKTLNGVTDYGYFDEASPDFGAYFGKEVARLYGRADKVRVR